MRWWAEIRDVALLGGVAIVLGLAAIAAHDLPFVAPPPPETALACGDDGGLVATDDAAAEDPVLPRIRVEEVAAGLGRPGMTVVDARAGDAYVQGHIPGALHVPAWGADDVLRTESLPIPPDDLVVVYCDEGAELSDYLGSLLRAQVGCPQVRVIEGGWNAWLAAGAPVEGDLVRG